MVANSRVRSSQTFMVFLLLIVIGSASPWISSRAQAADRVDELMELLEKEEVLTLSLRDAVLRALESNLDISVSRQARDVRVTDILFQQAQFDPTVNLTSRYDRTISPVNRPILGFTSAGQAIRGEPQKLNQSDTEFSFGVSQTLLTGGNYDLSLETRRNAVAGQTNFLFNPAYDSSFLLNLAQPLLRNFGVDVNSTQIMIAQNAAKIEHYVFADQVLQVIADVEQAYWELVFARENKKVAEANLNAARQLVSTNRAKVKVGVLAEVDVLQAESAVAARVEEVLLAQQAIRDQEDQLRQLFSPDEAYLRRDVVVVPLDRPIEVFDRVTAKDAIDVALRQRPEVLQAKKDIETRDLNTKFAKNQLLPDLSFQGTLGLTGLGEDFPDTFDRNFSGDFYDAGAGLVLSYPLGNRGAKSQYHARQLEVLQAQATFQKVRYGVIVNVKEAVRRVQTDFKRIETTKSARKLAEKQLKAEQERLNLGLSATHLVLQFQGELAIARGNELRAIIDYNQSLSNLGRARATTFDRYEIALQ